MEKPISARTNYSRQRFLSRVDEDIFHRKYRLLDQALADALAPGSHKAHNPVIRRGLLAPKTDWPNIPAWADAVLAAVFLADDYINRVTTPYAVQQVLSDITNALGRAKAEAARRERNTAKERMKRLGMHEMAKDFVAIIGEYLKDRLVASENLCGRIRQLQQPPLVTISAPSNHRHPRKNFLPAADIFPGVHA